MLHQTTLVADTAWNNTTTTDTTPPWRSSPANSYDNITIITDLTEEYTDVGATHSLDPGGSNNAIISKETLRLIEDVIFLGLNWLLLVVGVVGNGLSCVVFWRQGLGDRMNVCLFSLGLVDLCCVWWKWTVRKYVRGLHRGFLFSSGCLTMLISVERCVCVWLPLKAASLVSTRSMSMCIVGTVLLIHLLHLVYPFKFSVVSVFDEATNTTRVFTRTTQAFRENQELFDFLENVMVMTVIPVVTFTVVVVATVLTAVRLVRMVKWRKAVSENATMKRSQMSLVKMLLVVSLIYIITSSPKVMLGLVRAFVPQFFRTGDYSNIFQATHVIYLALGTVNSTVNVFVYYSRSSRFRAEVRRLWLCRACVRRSEDTQPEKSRATKTTDHASE
ncbi:uncharacterized protein LOC143275069 [Babylonia areolata]|uniref:uncharacterized protein LOC143275069 n=1 Tax=Babylonia areolata TaxID=304850 RepID=UPI003FD2E357